MDVEVRALSDEAEVRQAWGLLVRAFNWPRDQEDRFVAETTALERTRGVFVGGELAACSRIRPFGQYWGARRVAMGGFSPVGTAPEHRGRGYAALVTTDQFPALRERGEVLAGLFPASTPLYRRVGFGLAGTWTARTIAAEHLRSLPATDVAVRRATRGDVPAISGCYAASAPATNGWLDRPAEWWKRILLDQWDDRNVYVVDGPEGGLDGYLEYEHKAADGPGFGIEVGDLVAHRAEVALALWRLVGSSSSLVRDVAVHGPPEHPLLLVLPEQHLRTTDELRWMLRLVDAPGAVAARGFPAGLRADVPLEIADQQCPWNEGRFRLVVEDGQGRLEPGGPGTVRLGPPALASLYSGYAGAGALASAGLLQDASGTDLAALTAAFTGPTPWMPDFF